MSKLELYYPVKPIVNQYFGGNGDYYKSLGLNIIGHNGWDFQAFDGQPIYAAHDGVVTFTGEDGKGGLGVIIRTKEQFEDINGDSRFYKSIYWHLKASSFNVKPGDEVKAGHLLAEADNTGLSTGSHLHFGLKPIYQGEADTVWYNSESSNGYLGAVDPKPYFNGYEAKNAQSVITNLTTQISLLKKLVELLKGFFKS